MIINCFVGNGASLGSVGIVTARCSQLDGGRGEQRRSNVHGREE